MTQEFKEFPKIARLNREVVVTEKIDGTNAQVVVVPLDGQGQAEIDPFCIWRGGYRQRADGDGLAYQGPEVAIFAGSRNRYLTTQKDNFGFSRWVEENAEDLVKLGPGTHYGEWWGSGVQRGYGLVNGEKRFSLFNVGRWYDEHGTNIYGTESIPWRVDETKAQRAPHCCHVVPILSVLPNFSEVGAVLEHLRAVGSFAAPGFMKPEGIVAFHSASGSLYKATCEKDEKPKGQAA